MEFWIGRSKEEKCAILAIYRGVCSATWVHKLYTGKKLNAVFLACLYSNGASCNYSIVVMMFLHEIMYIYMYVGKLYCQFLKCFTDNFLVLYVK